MTDFINKKALPMIFWQKDTTGTWHDYAIPVYVTKDISTIEGLREVIINFYDDPSEIGYYPRQNDIMVPAVNRNDSGFGFWGLSWTTPYFMDDFLENTNVGNGVLFLTQIEDNNFKFVPVFGLDEDTLFLKGNYKIEYIVSNCAKNVWDRLTSEHPYLKQWGSGSSLNPVSYDTKNYKYYDNPTEVNMYDIFKTMIAGVNGDFDIIIKTYQNSNKPFTLDVINRTGYSNFILPIPNEKIVDYSKRSRNRTDGTNLVYGYNQTTGALYKYAWLDKVGKLTIGTTYPKANTPRLGYCELDGDNPTDGELITRATSMLKGSLFYDYDEIDLKIDMANRYEIGTRNNPALPVTNENRLSTVYLNTIVAILGITDTPTYLEVREIDLLGGYIIVGKNDDITLGD